MTNKDQATYLDFAKQLALDAGDIMLKHFQIGVATEDKTDNTPVTIADTEVNQLVIDRIKKPFRVMPYLEKSRATKLQMPSLYGFATR